MATGQPESGPTVRRIILGNQLRQLREAVGVTRERAAYEVRGSDSKISRMELGRVSFKKRDVADLLTLYGVTDDDERAALLDMAGAANQPGWWHHYSDLLPQWFQTYVDREEAASRIRTYELQFIPGLLQSEAYARAVVMLGHATAPAGDIERRVHLRMTRQQILTREENPPKLWAVIDEAALRRPIGGNSVMRAQLEHLLNMAQLPNVTIQVMPFRFGGHAAEGGPFTIFRFADDELPDIVYVEQLTSAFYVESRSEVDQYNEAMNSLSVNGEDPATSIDTIAKVLRDA